MYEVGRFFTPTALPPSSGPCPGLQGFCPVALGRASTARVEARQSRGAKGRKVRVVGCSRGPVQSTSDVPARDAFAPSRSAPGLPSGVEGRGHDDAVVRGNPSPVVRLGSPSLDRRKKPRRAVKIGSASRASAPPPFGHRVEWPDAATYTCGHGYPRLTRLLTYIHTYVLGTVVVALKRR